VDRYDRGDHFQAPAVCGRGGTDFRPVFAHVEAENVQPACLIYLTDLEGSYPETEPDYPVLWIATTNHRATWGETIRLDIHR
jgi:predicted metal-dependent peptidase